MRRWFIAIGVLLVLLLAAGGWLAWSAMSVFGDLSAARDQIASAQQAIAARDAKAASTALTEASSSATSAAAELSQPIWSLAAAVPRLGDTPRAVRAVGSALDQALTALAPAAQALVGLEPKNLIKPGGTLNLPALVAAKPLVSNAQAGVDQALTTLAAGPQAAEGAMVIRTVDGAQKQLAEQLTSVDSTLQTVSSLASLAPPLLGADKPQRYFVAMLNPNEARGAGGFLGTWAVVRADQGKLTVERVGSNTDLPSFQSLPIDLGTEFDNRYGSDPALIGNMNLSPNFPDAAKLWSASYQAMTGEQLDGVIGADIVALGDLLTASGKTVTQPDGTVMNGKQLTDFALVGVYEKFPTEAQAAERKQYQEEVARKALDVITAASNPEAIFSALAKAAGQRRVMLYTKNGEVEPRLLDLPIGGSLAASEGPSVFFAPISVSGSKLDAWLRQEVSYEVGRCPDATQRVRSQVTVDLLSDLPTDREIPDYMISMAERSKAGPVNRTLAQLHLPIGAKITDVTLDGFPVEYTPFTEQGRPSLFVDVQLPPGQTVELQVLFTEPASAAEPHLVVQPLAETPKTEVVERPC